MNKEKSIPEEVKEKIEKESNKRWPRVAGYGNWINRDDAVELAEWALQEFSGMKGWHVGMKVIEEGGNKGTIHGIMAIEGQTRLLVDCSSNQWYWTSEKNIKPLEGDTVSKEEGKVYELLEKLHRQDTERELRANGNITDEQVKVIQDNAWEHFKKENNL